MFQPPFLRRDLPTLKGGRVSLRMPAHSDYRQWAALREESRDFLVPWEPAWSADELSRQAFRQRLRRYRDEYDRGTGLTFFVFLQETEALAGGLSLSNIRRGVAQTATIGYWMGAPHAGQGLMLDALKLVIPFAFGRLSLHRLEAACIPENQRSVRLLEKAGFRREGLARSYLKINGAWQDHVLYALVAGEHQMETGRG
ncbi:GNAT family N-acetyltransferase [Nitratireductor basaltis]|uniref:N-acetyltransferase GCN5 n=1 Tax=Nitratireductor basaltis TaxID=472175 RepID=A0A084UCQ7_9HYPH|nr:GNAT family protein [Nitratireductor basaltis]KFB10743.1 N-acetyltransferase GCN5 [Nitratireductor basaltis]